MHKIQTIRKFQHPRRGQALIVALVIVVCLMLAVAATQIQSIAELTGSKRDRDYERALQMAEAGANAYINEISNGFVNATYSYMPAYKALNSNGNGDVFPITCALMKTRILAGTYAANKYPANSQQGYYVGHTTYSTSVITVISYGWSNGVVRRIQVAGTAFSIFDWAALYGLNPATTGNNYCWKFSGSANIVGGSGGEGLITSNNNATYYDGPVVFAGAGAAGNAFPTILTSGVNVPTGHAGVGTLASPSTHRYKSTLSLPTADQAANSWALTNLGVTSTTGVEYYRTHNNNATGIKYLVSNNGTGAIRELAGSFVMNDTQLDGEFNPSNGTLNTAGKVNGETYYGLRFYPGNYFFEQVTMQATDKMYLRTFTDAERSTISGRAFVVTGDPANPNSGQAANSSVRFWIGKRTSGNDYMTTFNIGTAMEYTAYGSRFRVYVSSTGGVTVKGTNTSPPPPFRVNMLVYNKDSSGNGYGSVAFSSSTYVYGSLIGWQIDVAGGCTIQKETPELGPGADILTFVVNAWKELP